jgi:hypothetical protein
MESFLYKRYILIFHYGDNSQTGRYNFGDYHYNGKSVCIFQIKAFYLKKLHFNCTLSLDPVSIIYKQGYTFGSQNKVLCPSC